MLYQELEAKTLVCDQTWHRLLDLGNQLLILIHSSDGRAVSFESHRSESFALLDFVWVMYACRVLEKVSKKPTLKLHLEGFKCLFF